MRRRLKVFIWFRCSNFSFLLLKLVGELLNLGFYCWIGRGDCWLRYPTVEFGRGTAELSYFTIESNRDTAESSYLTIKSNRDNAELRFKIFYTIKRTGKFSCPLFCDCATFAFVAELTLPSMCLGITPQNNIILWHFCMTVHLRFHPFRPSPIMVKQLSCAVNIMEISHFITSWQDLIFKRISWLFCYFFTKYMNFFIKFM